MHTSIGRHIAGLAAGVGALLIGYAAPPAAAQDAAGSIATPPPCWPAQVGGTGTAAVRVTSDYGQAIMWWCGQEAYGIVSAWAYTLKIPDAMPRDLLGAVAALWNANVLEEFATPERDALKAAARAELLPLRPPPEVWVVAPNWTFYTRPGYLLEAGALKTTSVRVPVLTDGKPTPCDLARGKLVNGSTTYGAVPQPPELAGVLVAVCRVVK
jgi:hypothetical protein